MHQQKHGLNKCKAKRGSYIKTWVRLPTSSYTTGALSNTVNKIDPSTNRRLSYTIMHSPYYVGAMTIRQ